MEGHALLGGTCGGACVFGKMLLLMPPQLPPPPQLNCRCNYLCNCRRCRCLSSVFRDRLRSLARSRPRARLPESWRLEPLKSTKVD